MNRLAIFASYSNDNKIHDYVIYYLKGLKEVCDAIIFVADCDIEDAEKNKLEGLVTQAICQRHGCYDFGSYKTGFKLVKENHLLDNVDELVFCNDSCYGPTHPFAEVFETMKEDKADFWGLVRSEEIKNHLQSYFLVFKRQVFTSEAFNSFVNGFTKQESMIQYVIKYELNFTEILIEAGFTCSSFLDRKQHKTRENIIKGNPTKYPVTLYNLHLPLLKKKSYLLDFSSELKESIAETHKELEIQNPVLHSIINNEIKQYYSTGDNKTEDWLDIAIETAGKDNVLQTLAASLEKTYSELNKTRWRDAFTTSQEDKTTYTDSDKILRQRNLLILILSIVIALHIIYQIIAFL